VRVDRQIAGVHAQACAHPAQSAEAVEIGLDRDLEAGRVSGEQIGKLALAGLGDAERVRRAVLEDRRDACRPRHGRRRIADRGGAVGRARERLAHRGFACAGRRRRTRTW
jgi:hypothetical protein